MIDDYTAKMVLMLGIVVLLMLIGTALAITVGKEQPPRSNINTQYIVETTMLVPAVSIEVTRGD